MSVTRRNGKRVTRADAFRAAIDRACEIAGSQKMLARRCRVSQPAIAKARRTRQVSARLALSIHHVTDGQVPGSLLRPDLWLKPDDVPTK